MGSSPPAYAAISARCDQAGARRGVGESDDDQQLIGVGDDDALGGVGVIGGAPQHGSPLTAPHDARQGVGLARDIADDADVVADDDRRATQFPGPHGGDEAVGVAARARSPTGRGRR